MAKFHLDLCLLLGLAIVTYTFKANYKSLHPCFMADIVADMYEIRFNINGVRAGPRAFGLGLLDAAKTFIGRCTFIEGGSGYEDIEANDNPHRFFYTLRPVNFHKVSNQIYRRSPTKLRNGLFGPIPIPKKWFDFPNGEPMERNFPSVLEKIGAWVVHTPRVRAHIANRSNTWYLKDKYAMISACTNLLPTEIKPWDEREHDVIMYEKYADLDRGEEGWVLYKMLIAANLSVLRMSYRGRDGYTKEKMMNYANNTKFIIYFSFYDTGSIGLKEIQNFGIYTFAHQEDQVEDERTGLRVTELDNHDMEGAFARIMKRMKEINELHPDTKEYARINQMNNKCERSLRQMCDFVRKAPTFAD